MLKTFTALSLLALASSTAHAEAEAPRLDGFAFDVKESTGEWHRAWIISKLTTINVGKTCAKNMSEHKDKNALGAAGRYTLDVAEYAKLVTGDDWDRIESQNGDRIENAKLVEPMIEAFGKKFHFTLNVEGDDCDTKVHAFWMRYWHYASSALLKYPTRSGKAFITVNVKSKVKDITVDVDKSGSTFVITAPKDIEPPPPYWPDKIEKPFRKVSSKS